MQTNKLTQDTCRKFRLPYQSSKRYCYYCQKLYIPKTFTPVKSINVTKKHRLAALNNKSWWGKEFSPEEQYEHMQLIKWNKNTPKILSKRWWACSDKCYCRWRKLDY